jgi:hypothetical protein
MYPLRTLFLPLLALLALTLPACGGGGGGDGGNTGNVNDPIGQLPAIISTNPANGATDVSANTLIEVAFDNDLDQAALPAVAIQIRFSGGAVQGQTSYDAARRSLVFSPTNPLRADEVINVTVLAGIADVDGNVRTDAYSFAFTTAPIVPGTALPHENDAEDTQLLGFSVGRGGYGASLTATVFPNRTDIILRPYHTVTGFGAPINVDSFVGTVTANRDRSVGVAFDGKGIAVWRLNGPNGADVYAVPFDAAAGTAGATHTLDSTPDASDIPQIAMASGGDALIAWTQRATGGDRKVYGVGYEEANGFSVRANLEPNAGDSSSPKLSVNNAGQAVVAWTLALGNDFATRARTWKAGSWTTVHTVWYLANTRALAEKCLVSTSGECTVIIQFANTPVPNYRSVRTKRYRPSNLSNPGWQTLEIPSPEAGENLKIDASLISGNGVFLVYAMDANGGAILEARQHEIATGWSAPINVTNLPLVSFSGLNVRLVSRSDRHHVVDWGYNNGATNTRRATLFFNTTQLYRDVIVPAKVNSGRGVVDVFGNVRFVSRVDGVSNGLETVVVDVNGVAGPVQRVDTGAATFIPDYTVDQAGNGRGAIIWEERPGAAGTPYDVMHALLD